MSRAQAASLWRRRARVSSSAPRLATASPALTNSARPRPPLPLRVIARRCVVSDPPLPLLSLLAGQVCVYDGDGGRCPCKEPGDDCKCEVGHEHVKAVSAGGESRCTNNHDNASAAAHISARPGPGEPSGFLVVPGRAEGVPRPGWAVAASNANATRLS